MARLARTATGHAALLTDAAPTSPLDDRYVRVADDGTAPPGPLALPLPRSAKTA